MAAIPAIVGCTTSRSIAAASSGVTSALGL